MVDLCNVKHHSCMQADNYQLNEGRKSNRSPPSANQPHHWRWNCCHWYMWKLTVYNIAATIQYTFQYWPVNSILLHYNHFMALWTLSGTTRVSQYQKKHLPTHTYHSHQSCLICFLPVADPEVKARGATVARGTVECQRRESWGAKGAEGGGSWEWWPLPI